ncbi:MAG: acyl-phosphate glycerol 3-phosphate acyltransferase [Flavobacteriales bacterium]|nr:acyl-phosphate glycerol 3-phosphate acyltransferase [Flavobacteriales bacterium]|tara:strand:+ start:5123 stop:5806 length:684 start_codon:yes stop_codon:yes gene_type:complete
MTFTIVLLLVLAYILGSIPSAVWVGKTFHGIDVREHGSGNAGATNTFRVLGKKAGIPVLLLDILKGALAINLVWLQSRYGQNDITPFTNLKLAFGFCAVVGHIFPIFAGFRGGKGIATLLGIVLAVHPPAAMCSLALFLLILITTKYVSLGSIFAGIAFPLFISLVFKTQVLSLVIFSSVVAVLIVVTHQKNIQRLLKNNENKTYLFGKRHKIANIIEEQEVDEFSK